MSQTDEVIISGIQQVGIGVADLEEAFRWYRRSFGMDIPAFDDEGEAALMLPYTGGRPHARRAVLAINLQGGSGFEVWQYRERRPASPTFEPELGDLGIFAARIKARRLEETYEAFRRSGMDLAGAVAPDPGGEDVFFLRDPYGNHFQVVEEQIWFSKSKGLTGGCCGCIIGVSDIERSRRLYSDVLGYDRVIYDRSGIFEDLRGLPGEGNSLRRVLMGHSRLRSGVFSRMWGPSRIELVQKLEGKPRKIFAGRYWGDLGFIHLCFDIHGMARLKDICEQAGFPFTVESSKSFDMGEAAGQFSYIEDPDGTLIEFVETHRIPLIRKLGWYLDIRKRDPRKPLPNWMLKSQALSRIRD